jgi:hypothetical protein
MQDRSPRQTRLGFTKLYLGEKPAKCRFPMFPFVESALGAR